MTAFGYLRNKLMVVRCDCGAFEVRRVKKWLERVDGVDCCVRCDEASYAKTGRYLAAMGKYGKERQPQP